MSHHTSKDFAVEAVCVRVRNERIRDGGAVMVFVGEVSEGGCEEFVKGHQVT